MADSAYACTAETARAAEQLGQIGDMLPAARDVAHGLSRRAGGGNTAGKPGSRLPFDLGATSRLSRLQDRLTRWCRQIAAQRGLPPPWVTTYGDPITVASGWLNGQTEWIRHQGPTTDPLWLHTFGWEPDEIDNVDPNDPPLIAAAFLRDIEAGAHTVAGIARGPAAQKYLGPCGAPTLCDVSTLDEPPGTTTVEGAPCEGDVYARETASVGRCRLCGAEVSTDARRAWLDAEVRAHAFRAAHIAQAYGVNVKTIRSWADRKHLLEHRRDREGRPLYLLGDVLDLAAADAARKAEDQARRARRATRRDNAA